MFFLTSFSETKKVESPSENKFKLEEVKYFDNSRHREIPVALYIPANKKQFKKLPLIIFSHGYGENYPNSYLYYSYLTESLAKNEYFVASIQHELPNDELLPLTGIPQVERRPNWERGSENIKFVLNKLKQDYPQLNYSKVTVIGHSNGGDMTVLFADKNPELVSKVITLDHRRYPFPKVSKPEIYSIRSSDQAPDEGVLPNEEEQKRLGITIVKLKNTTHNQMSDNANEEQRKEINNLIINFLK